MQEIVLRPIGVVHNDVTTARHGEWHGVVSRLELEPQYAEALADLVDFSHVEVIFWIDRAHAPEASRIHPRGRSDLPLVSYFATRTPNRPNRLGLSTVKLLSVEGSTLVVEDLDAFDGTPVLDVKPFIPREELAQGVRIPEWLSKLRSVQE